MRTIAALLAALILSAISVADTPPVARPDPTGLIIFQINEVDMYLVFVFADGGVAEVQASFCPITKDCQRLYESLDAKKSVDRLDVKINKPAPPQMHPEVPKQPDTIT